MEVWELCRESVPDARHRFDTDLPTLELLAEVGDMHVHRAGLPVKIEAPRNLEQLFPAEDAARLRCKRQQEIELLGAQANDARAKPDLAPERGGLQLIHVD